MEKENSERLSKKHMGPQLAGVENESVSHAVYYALIPLLLRKLKL